MCLTIHYDYAAKRKRGKGYKVVRVNLSEENPIIMAPCREYVYSPSEWNTAHVYSFGPHGNYGFHIYTRLSDAKRAFPDYAATFNNRYETVKLYRVAYADVLSHGLGDGGFTPVPALKEPNERNQPIVVLARRMKLLGPVEIHAS